MNSDFCVAVHALVYLNHRGCVLSSDELAKNICTNPTRVRKVMGKLKTVGLIETKEGSDGGYRFMGDAEQVTLEHVAQALHVRFVSTTWHSGSQDKHCLIASGMADVMEGLWHDLDACCKARLREQTIAEMEQKIFKNARNQPEVP